LRVWTSSALAADTGGALSLGGVTGGSSSAFGQIAGRKANATSNDYAGYLQFATNTPVGTMAERMRIDSSGRVGIGTASPGSLLHVYGGDARVQKGVNFTDVSEITLANTYRTGRILSAYTNYVSVTETYIAFCTNITGQANDTVGETMRLAGGKLGIGTSSPGYKLTVQSDSADTSYATPYNNYGIIIRNDDQTNNNYSGFSFNTKDSLGSDNTMAAIAAQCTNHTSGATNGTLAFFTTGSGTLTERARIDSSGRLLVGTSSVSQDSTLVLQGRSSSSSGSAVIRLNVGTAIPADNDALGYLCFGDSSSCDAAYVWAQRDGGTWSGSSKPTRLVFSTTPSGSASPTERMRITSTGFLKVSNTGSYAITAVGTPNSHEVNQSLDNIAAFHAVHSGATGPYGYYYKSTAADPNNTSYYVFGAFQNTNVNIYTIWSNGTVSARSDIRYKKNVETTRNGYLEDLSRLRVVKYNWYNHEDDAPKELGFIAQEVEEVFPGLVLSQPETDSEGNETGEVCKSIKFSVFTPMLVKALQEAMERIETLEAKVAALETK
jgi:hypothetical protein